MSQTFGPDAQVLNTGSSLQAAPPQSATGKEIPAMSNIAALPFTKEFVSAEQTITPAGSLTLAHSLGAIPKLVTRTLVCKVAEHGYSIGDTIDVTGTQDASVSYGIAIVPDTINLVCRYGNSANVFFYLNKTTGSTASLVNANWRLVVRAWA